MSVDPFIADSGGITPSSTTSRYVNVYETVGPDNRPVANTHPLHDDRIWADVDVGADSSALGYCMIPAAGQCPSDGVMRVDVSTGGDGAVVTDFETTRTVK